MAKTQQTGARQLKLAHLEAMEDNGYEKNDLPTAIKKQINTLDMLTKRYSSKPTDSMADTIEKNSVKIADAIQTFAEEEINEEAEAEEAKLKEAEAAKSKEAEDAKLKEAEAAKAKEAEDAKLKEEEEAKKKELEAAEAIRLENERKERDGSFNNPFIKAYTGR